MINSAENTWYIFGDSIAKGIIFDEISAKYSICKHSFVNLLSEKYDVKIKNFSVFGATINKGLQMFARNEKKLNAGSLAFLEFGGNDCDFVWQEVALTPQAEHLPNTPPEEFQSRYEQFIHLLKEKNIKPIILNLPPLDEKRYFAYFSKNLNKENLLKFLGGSARRVYQWHESYNNLINQIGINTKSYVIDIRQNFLTKLNPERFLCVDGIHPNEKGQRLIADKILQNISESDLISNLH